MQDGVGGRRCGAAGEWVRRFEGRGCWPRRERREWPHARNGVAGTYEREGWGGEIWHVGIRWWQVAVWRGEGRVVGYGVVQGKSTCAATRVADSL